MKRNTGRNSKIVCRKVEEKEGKLYFWIRDEETDHEWVFYTSIEQEDIDVYCARDDSCFMPDTDLDKMKLLRMIEQYQLFIQDKARREAQGKLLAGKQERSKRF
ncbi:hypothetical protein [Exiguobacterium aurantiacum]|uniref:Uncharacterized protein n=1 Tax=Exiguobacterium aurantiacum TaxID=33987 RepID=A0ABY5FJJ2_9BACL|nr:hypothetical protein [Exiguobacterium aurantiacum]UTT41565.1 hypothetical protein NMQ00_08285 [Exiguobacterium aurantiacum]